MDGKVPVAYRDAHWRDSVVARELMTPTLSTVGSQPLSAITVQSLADLGHRVDVGQAEPYTLPSLAPRFAPPGEVTGEPVPGRCIAMSDSHVLDDGRALELPPHVVTATP